jgi:hypothetical protein
MAKTRAEEVKHITLPETEERVMEIDITGNEMLHNKMTTAARNAIIGIKTPKYKEDHSKKSEKWEETVHYDMEGRLGFPAEAFMKAMATVLKSVDLSKKKLFKGKNDLFRALHVESDSIDDLGVGLVLYDKGTKATMSTHWGVLRGQTPIPLYRGIVKDWKMTLRIVYDETWLTHEDVMLLVRAAGRRIGIGAYRIEKGGAYGRFEIKSARLVAIKAKAA